MLLSLPGVFETWREESRLLDMNTKLSHLDCVTNLGQQSPHSLYLIILVCVIHRVVPLCYILMYTDTSSLLIPLLLVSSSVLPPTTGQTSLHVFNHEPTGQAERGKKFYIFNVVQPTEADDIFSSGVPNVALRNQREFYIIDNVEVSDDVRLQVQYFASVDQNAQSRNAENLGSLFTDINVIGKP